MSIEPSPQEVMRRLDEVATQMSRLADKLERDYLPREVYKGNREADRADTTDLRARLDRAEAQAAAMRRLYLSTLVAPIIVGLVLLYIAAQIGGATP